MSHAMGAKTKPRIWPRLEGNQGRPPWTHARSMSSKRDQGEEGNQHDGHVHGQLAAVDGAARNGADESSLPCAPRLLGMMTRPSVSGTSVSGTSILAMRMVPGEVMMTAESRCRASTPCEMYMAMMPPETCAMPLVMMVISSTARGAGQKGPDRERRFGLAHEDAGGDVHAFGAGDAHRLAASPTPCRG